MAARQHLRIDGTAFGGDLDARGCCGVPFAAPHPEERDDRLEDGLERLVELGVEAVVALLTDRAAGQHAINAEELGQHVFPTRNRRRVRPIAPDA